MAGYYKQKKKGAGRHVQLPEWLMRTHAWSTMPIGPRCLYIELKRRYLGGNNGDVRLSHREAALALGVTKNTVGPYFKELERRGFIIARVGHCLGPTGIGQTTKWVLTEYPTPDLKPAKKTFASWQGNPKPPPKKQDAASQLKGQ